MLSSDLPLHPAVVHLPIALTLVMPLIIFILIVIEKQEMASLKNWSVALILQIVVAASSMLASNLGEKDEEIVERVVSGAWIHLHEEWGEKVVWFSFGVLGVMILSLLLRRVRFVKFLVLLASLAAIYPVLQAGKSGGELVYRHGAAQAHIQAAGSIPSVPVESQPHLNKPSSQDED